MPEGLLMRDKQVQCQYIPDQFLKRQINSKKPQVSVSLVHSQIHDKRLKIIISTMDIEQEAPVQPRRVTPNILVTGTPGTGKTTICTLLNQSLHFTYLNIGSLINEKKLYKQWNQEFNVPVFDEDLVLDYIQGNYDVSKGGLLVEFHSSDFFPLRYFDLVILLRCNNQVLYPRLESRGYPQKKISENIDCEIHQVTHEEVHESYSPDIILELRNEAEGDVQANLNTIISWLQKYKETTESQTITMTE